MNPNFLPVDQYAQLLANKTERLQTKLAPFTSLPPTVFASPPSHYRMRAEFRIWHDGEDLYHIMFDPHTKQRVRVDQFPAASKLINELMPRLLAEIRAIPILRHKLFQIDYLSTCSGQIIVSLLYHKRLDDQWQGSARQLLNRLHNYDFNLQLIGRAAKQKICLHHDYVDETLVVAGRRLIYRQVENSFTQPNAAININMLEWALKMTENATGDLLELYCGNGNFSLALARNFDHVLATEIAKPSVAAAQYNIEANQIENVDIIRMSAEEFTQALNGERPFNRLQHIDLKGYQCNTILVDPPRAGLDDDTLDLVKTFQNILYISCNPDTLCQNLIALTQTHRISNVALFDQFPYTSHMECGVLLQRNT